MDLTVNQKLPLDLQVLIEVHLNRNEGGTVCDLWCKGALAIDLNQTKIHAQDFRSALLALKHQELVETKRQRLLNESQKYFQQQALTLDFPTRKGANLTKGLLKELGL